MIYVKKQLTEDATVQIELNEDTEFYTRCGECGQELKATDEILDDFSEFLFGSCCILCEKCTAKHDASEKSAK